MIKEMVEKLLPLENCVWDSYALRKEPLIGKITPEQQTEFTIKARQSGVSIARQLKELHNGVSPAELAELAGLLGVKINRIPSSDGGNYTMFACFHEPDQIFIYQATVENTEHMIEIQGLSDLLEHVRVEDVLIAHELYHFFECRHPDLYTNQRVLTLWKIGKLIYTSRVSCLHEIAAMSFTQELLGLSYSPYVYDVVLLYAQNKRMSKKLYESICGIDAQKEVLQG
ncbi:hypothetical protein V6615_13030 [Oscillospiraceae bacterium PP1C4]